MVDGRDVGRRNMPAESLLLRPTIHGLLRMRRINQMSLAGVELRWHQKRLDFAVLAGDQTVAVELKVDNWRRAVEQAYVNRWYADESWIGLWHLAITPAAVAAAAEAGVGVLIVTRRTVYPLHRPPPAPHLRAGTELRELLRAGRTRVRDVLGEVRARDVPALA